MKYRKRPVVIEAITFDELVAHGGAHNDTICTVERKQNHLIEMDI